MNNRTKQGPFAGVEGTRAPKLNRKVADHLAEQDFRWFDEHPERCMRLRLAEPAEIARIKGQRPVPPGLKHTTFGIRLSGVTILYVPTAVPAYVDVAELDETDLLRVLYDVMDQDPSVRQRVVAAVTGVRA